MAKILLVEDNEPNRNMLVLMDMGLLVMNGQTFLLGFASLGLLEKRVARMKRSD